MVGVYFINGICILFVHLFQIDKGQSIPRHKLARHPNTNYFMLIMTLMTKMISNETQVVSTELEPKENDNLWGVK